MLLVHVNIQDHGVVEVTLLHGTPQVRLNMPHHGERALTHSAGGWHNSDERNNTAKLFEETPGIWRQAAQIVKNFMESGRRIAGKVSGQGCLSAAPSDCWHLTLCYASTHTAVCHCSPPHE